jgi:hypothetical protein
VELKGTWCLDSECLADGNLPNLPYRLPHFEILSSSSAKISLGNDRDQVEDLTVGDRPEQFYVFRMRPHQRHG